MIIINFKNYKIGKEALKLSRLIEKYLPDAIVAVSVTDIEKIVSKTRLKVYAQHVDYFEKRNTTGFVIPEDVKDAGAVGTLLNHSEHQIREETIEKTIERCNEVGLRVLLCVDSVKRANLYKRFRPGAMAYEDRELIGTGKSITEYRKGEVKKFVTKMKYSKIKLLCGAGINSAEDIREAYNLGCRGILISSAIAKVPLKKAEKLLREICRLKQI
ncbi:triose-phosphate isomerase [Candidatus Pacearchaeota archaeon]|nr:triose-phosphate isomerase [Candidatus Pacearchaeota archaeon]